MAGILIVEDEPDIAELYRLVLEDSGHTVLGPFADPREPLERASSRRIDLILLDERLGLFSGTSFVDQYRGAFPKAKIALVSADPLAVAAGRAHGADSVLKKPVRLSQLLNQVSQLLS